MDWKHLCDINKPNQPFSVFGRLITTFANGEWTWTEELFETPYEKQYHDDKLDYSKYVYLSYGITQYAALLKKQ